MARNEDLQWGTYFSVWDFVLGCFYWTEKKYCVSGLSTWDLHPSWEPKPRERRILKKAVEPNRLRFWGEHEGAKDYVYLDEIYKRFPPLWGIKLGSFPTSPGGFGYLAFWGQGRVRIGWGFTFSVISMVS